MRGTLGSEPARGVAVALGELLFHAHTLAHARAHAHAEELCHDQSLYRV